jgi:hypothetical protein
VSAGGSISMRQCVRHAAGKMLLSQLVPLTPAWELLRAWEMMQQWMTRDQV